MRRTNAEAEPRFIVAEVSKNWPDSRFPDGNPPPEACLCGLFERLIAVNLDRGYRLHSFQVHRLMSDRDHMNETVIAVFQKSPPAEEPDE